MKDEDIKVMVWNDDMPEVRVRRYLYGSTKDRVTVHSFGLTSFTNLSGNMETWENMELVE